MQERFLALIRGERRGLGALLLRGGLRMLSWPYGWATALRNRAFDRGWKKIHTAPVPVISVGNLTTGGTGKTPCVEWIARFLREEDLRVAILSRGYGAAEGRNDEALVLEENLPDVPHLQGADRAALAAVAVEELESEVLVLDDGFQHRRLRRDLDLVLLDATDPWGSGFQLPRGLLREAPRGLRRASLVMLTRCDQAAESELLKLRHRVETLAPGVPLLETEHRPACWIDAAGSTTPLDGWAGRPLAGFCGLGNPEGFRRTLEHLGQGVPCCWRTFPDHHAYTREDVEDLRQWAGKLPAEALVATTQKDLVKLRVDHLAGRPLRALKIALEFRRGREVLEQRLRSLVACSSSA